MTRISSEKAKAERVKLNYEAIKGKLADEYFDDLKYTDEYGVTLPYRIYVPSTYDEQNRYPLLVNFHSAGEIGTDNKAPIGVFDTMQFPEQMLEIGDECIAIAMQTPRRWVDQDWGLGCYDQDALGITPDMRCFLSLVHQTMKQYSIDSERVYAFGISMGGFGTFEAITQEPQLFAGAIELMGAGDPSKMELIKDIPILMSHGSVDPIVPVTAARQMARALEKVGGLFHYTEKPGVGHEFRPELTTPKELKWLFEQHKGYRPIMEPSIIPND